MKKELIISNQRLAVVLALVSSFIVFVDTTIVNLALPIIEQHLTASRSQLEWVINGYTLSFAAVMLGSGALADSLGPRRVFLFGILLFLGASVICALSGTTAILNISRIVQGIGAALILPSSLTLATRTQVSDTKRHQTIGYWAAAGGIGLAAGPFLGGVLISIAGWTSIFWVNVFICVPVLLIGLWKLPQLDEKARQLDILGQLTATMSIAGLVFVLIEAPTLGWSHTWIIISFVIMLVGIIAFSIVEKRVSAPLLPRDIYHNRIFLISTIQGALFNFMFYGLLFALSFQFQQGRGLSPMISGLSFLPMTGLVAVGNLSAARIAACRNRVYVLYLGQSVLTLSLIVILLLGYLQMPLWCTLLALMPAGFSSGLLVPTMTSQTLSTVSPNLHGAASAAFNTSRQVGGAIGVAVFGPLLGIMISLDNGFIMCVLLSIFATMIAFLLTRYIKV
ncbi:MFS transporter [Xenorhabdus kozodoii]|uniref:Tetracenomycin C resistance and export protein n=1 Tax=Xenorhabdus kozodoii TaxID=351676 RepID=A0A2D0L215_9GAMM|nr:MFS transporter [Xenorhabdus kozodoii]PHM69746.1 tetracenomycin C resistance and export protein [Xenorhabdus kozodoii]